MIRHDVYHENIRWHRLQLILFHGYNRLLHLLNIFYHLVEIRIRPGPALLTGRQPIGKKWAQAMNSRPESDELRGVVQYET